MENAALELKKLAEENKINPVFNHVGLLVKDIKKAAAAFDWIPGMGEWKFMEFKKDEFNLLVSDPFNIFVGKNMIGGIGLELIQPYDSPTSYMETYLREHGEGLHHFAYDFENNDEHVLLVEKMKAAGYTVVYSATFKGNLIHYIEAPNGGVVYELKSKMK